MILLKLLLNGLGLTGSGYLLYFDVGGWKGNALWYVMIGYWAVGTIRALVKLYFEIKEGQIELEAKRSRYKND
jgi:hypothetical protein